MNMRHKLGVIYILSGLMGMGIFAVPVLAESQGTCAADVQKFCSDIKPGDGRIAACLKAHDNEISDACKQQGQQLKAKAQAFEAACKDDLDKYCKDVQPGQGRKIKCLKDNTANLAPACKDAVSHMHGGVHIHPAGNGSQPPAPPEGGDNQDAH